MASKIKKRFVKNCDATFDKKIKFNCLSLKIDDDNLFKNRSKKPTFVTRPFLTILNLEVDRIFPQQLEYAMDYNCVEIGYCGHPTFPYTNIQLNKTSDLIITHLQKEENLFIHGTLKNKKKNWFTYIIFTNL